MCLKLNEFLNENYSEHFRMFLNMLFTLFIAYILDAIFLKEGLTIEYLLASFAIEFIDNYYDSPSFLKRLAYSFVLFTCLNVTFMFVYNQTLNSFL